MENIGIPIASFLLEIHPLRPSPATLKNQGDIACTERLLDAAGIAYRKFVPFSLALQKLALFRRHRKVQVKICVVPRKANLLFSQVYLDSDISNSNYPRCVVDGSEPATTATAKFIAAHFKSADTAGNASNEEMEILNTFLPPWRNPSISLRLGLKRSALRARPAPKPSEIHTSPVQSHGLNVGPCGFIGCTKCDAENFDHEKFRLDAVLDDCAAQCAIENSNFNFKPANHDQIVPGLKLHLYTHQRLALHKMLLMEQESSQDLVLPMIFLLTQLNGGAKVIADLFDGSIYLVPHVPTTTVPRGGLICDEPGLGKTITGLSLVLKTKNQRAAPPAGVETQTRTRGINRVFKYYVESDRCDPQTIPGVVGKVTRRKRILCAGNDTSDPPNPRSRRRRRSAGKERPAKPIFLSKATLVLAPRQVVQHWETQINEHTHYDSLQMLVTRDIKKLPSAESMANDYDVIVVSFEVLRAMVRDPKNHKDSKRRLLRVRFLRILFDEGHKIGTGTVFHDACILLNAERRWIMTGTPTPSSTNSDIRHLRPMLQFLQEPTYGLDSETWMNAIQKPYEAFKPEALDRLNTLLISNMIRTNKSSISIPKLVSKDVLLDFSVHSAKSYNQLVIAATRNLMTSDWFDETHAESFLNPKQSKFCRGILTDLRRSCCFCGLYAPKVDLGDLVHMLEMLYEKSKKVKDGSTISSAYSRSPLAQIRNWDRIVALQDELTGQSLEVTNMTLKLYLEKPDVPVINEPPTPALSEEQMMERPEVLRPNSPKRRKNTIMNHKTLDVIYRGVLKWIARAFLCGDKCDRCKTHTRSPVITPCCHVVCTSCILTDDKRCPVESCKTPYKLDENNVPEELIELQPSIFQGEWNKRWERLESSKISYLTKRLDEIGTCSYAPTGYSGGLKTRKKKCIIFSQFPEHLMLVSLTLKGSRFCNNYAELYPNQHAVPRNQDKHFDKELERFKNNDDCHILIMSADRGAVGLDLSFVHNIFLMEPIWDGSLEKQVIARAHRMGCKETVHVERLVMRNSIEHDMMRLKEEEMSEKKSGVGKMKIEYELARRRKLLLRLNIVFPSRMRNNVGSSNSHAHAQNQDEIVPATSSIPTEQEDMFNRPLLRAYKKRMLGKLQKENSSSSPKQEDIIIDGSNEDSIPCDPPLPGSPVTSTRQPNEEDSSIESDNDIGAVELNSSTPASNSPVTSAKRSAEDVRIDGNSRSVKRRLSYSAMVGSTEKQPKESAPPPGLKQENIEVIVIEDSDDEPSDPHRSADETPNEVTQAKSEPQNLRKRMSDSFENESLDEGGGENIDIQAQITPQESSKRIKVAAPAEYNSATSARPAAPLQNAGQDGDDADGREYKLGELKKIAHEKTTISELTAEQLADVLAAYVVNYDCDMWDEYCDMKKRLRKFFKPNFIRGAVIVEVQEDDDIMKDILGVICKDDARRTKRRSVELLLATFLKRIRDNGGAATR